MASIKKKLEKNGNVVYQVQASNGRGRRVWRTFRPEPTWSSRTVQRELQRFAAELESQLEDREVLTREETIQQAAAQAVEAAKVKTLRQYAGAVYLPEKAATVSEKTRASYTQLLERTFSRCWAMCRCRISQRPCSRRFWPGCRSALPLPAG